MTAPAPVFGSDSVAVPDEGLSFATDHAMWTLSDGVLRPAGTSAEGGLTACVFEGRGSVVLAVEPEVEREALRRCSGIDSDGTVELAFTRAHFRAGHGLEQLLGIEPSATASDTDGQLEKRENQWLRMGGMDVAARVLAAERTPGDDFLWVDFETEEGGWLTYELEPRRMEPVQLHFLDTGREFDEVWVSLQRPGDRRTAVSFRQRPEVADVQVRIDLTGHDAREDGVDGDDARFSAQVTLVPETSGARAVRMRLSRLADVRSVTGGDGADLDFVRTHTGGEFASVDRDLHDASLVVLLDEPLEAGVRRELTVDYTMEIYNYVSGSSWIPGFWEDWNDEHGATMTFVHDDAVEVRAVGTRVSSSQEDGVVTEVWRVDEPTKMVAFSFGKRYREEVVELDGVPRVVVFGRRGSVGSGNMVKNVAIDVAKSLHFFQWYFDTPLQADEIHVTRIAGGHGQAFEGFIHLSDWAFDAEHAGASELFRAHEAAHQFWGHRVSWRSYRDQWLSEALAEYSAMLFIEATMPDSGYFDEILKVYTAQQLGSLSGAMSRFARPGVNLDMRRSEVREQIGPIGMGYRASTARVPYGYQIQVYNKGALVVHMLRSVLRYATGTDAAFRAILKDFLETYSGRAASTRDFANSIAKHVGGDWSWFVDQWVHSTAIPDIRWEASIPKKAGPDGTYVVKVRVVTENLGDEFTLPLPVAVDYGRDRTSYVVLPVTRPDQVFDVPLSARPKELEVAPDFTVLATVKKL